MRILVVGGTGTLGSAVADDLDSDHDVIRAGRSGPDVLVDMTDPTSSKQIFTDVGEIDAMVICAGHVPFKPFAGLDEADFIAGLNSKLLGQINLVRNSMSALKKGGAIVLTSGVLADEPLAGSTCAATANGAINAFVMAFAAEQAGRLRINAVSPSIVENSVDSHGSLFVGFEPIPMSRLVRAYRRCLFGPISGRIVRI